jgi:DNA-directed RNA polymerase subunit F
MAAAVAIAVQKVFLPDLDARQWAGWWSGGALVGGCLLAIMWTWIIRRCDLDAAIEIDHRFGLKERVSSALALGPDELETPFGQALLNDTLRRVSRIDVSEKFPVLLSRNSWLPLVPAVVGAALFFFLNIPRSAEAEAKANLVAISKQIKESTEPLRKKLEERKKEATEKNLKEASELFKKIEDGARELNKTEGDRNQALTKLNDLTKEVEKRREQLAGGDKLKQQLAQMKNMPSGPADKLAQAMKNGDFDRALKELQNLKDQLAVGKLDPEKQKQLDEQLKGMEDAMKKIADIHQNLQNELKQQIEKARQAGDKEGAKKLQDKLAKVGNQQPQMDMLKKMAKKLGECAQCMKQGDGAEAQAGLAEMAKQMAEMQQEAAEMEMLEDALEGMQAAKDAMNCKQCGGQGCKACQGAAGMEGDNDQAGEGGLEAGRGRGIFKPRPNHPEDTKTYDSRVRQRVGQGAAVVTGLMSGPNAKGQAIEEIKSQVESARKETADPLTGQRLPRQQRDHVQQYFDAFRDGK